MMRVRTLRRSGVVGMWSVLSALAGLGGCASNSGDGATTGGTTGSGGGIAPETGGAPGSGGTMGSGGSSGGSGGTTGSGGVGGALEECATPSIDRYQEWLASGEGPTLPATGSILVAEGEGYVGRVEFTSGSEWHVVPVWLANVFEGQVDLSASSGFTLTYSATADFFVQVRPASAWSGGAKWHAELPSTGGVVQSITIPFDDASWFEKLGPPPHTLDEALAEARGFVFVGNEQNVIEFHGLRIDGYDPECQ